MKKIIIFIYLISINWMVDANTNSASISFQSGEQLTYVGYYNWKFVWVKAGEATFKVSDSTYFNDSVYDVQVNGYSYKAYDIFFKVRDSINVLMNRDNFEPYFFKRITNEGSYHAEHRYWFDKESRQVKSEIAKRNRSAKDSIVGWPNGFRDMVSSIYWVRNIEFSNYQKNDTISLKMFVDGELEDLYIRFKGKDKVKMKDGRKFRCLRFSPMLMDGTIFKEGEGMNVYVTDDKNRLPLLIETEILVGSLKGYLTDYKNLKWPLDSEIK